MTQTNMPHQLGNYRLIRLLGRGGFADVYLGRHIHLKSYAAVKVLRANISAEGLEDLFRQEAQTVAELTHPNIVRVLDFDVQGDTAFLVMDYAPYGSLRKQYPPATILPLDAVLSYVRQMASALYYAHQHRIIHRDVKPENMLVAKDARILLSDFGLALLAQSSQRTGEAAGTVGYVAPEQIEGKPRPASDQYALAITAYEWLCGTRPFKGTFTEITVQHLSALPPPLRAYEPSIPAQVEAVVLQALEKDPADRFPNVQEFATALLSATGVRPRPRSSERFVMPQQQQPRAKPDTLVLSEASGNRRGEDTSNMPTIRDRDLASVRTVVQQEPEGSRWSIRPGQPLRISRRTVLLGLAGVIGAGTVAIAFASMHSSPPAVRVLATATVPSGHVPTALPSATRTASPTKAPTPDPAPTTTQVQAPAPTQPPPPTPTPPTPAGTLLVTYRGHSNVVYSVAWSPDGLRIASGGGDKTMQEWYAADGSNAATYNRSAAVDFVAWSPDGARIASASDDKTVQIYNTAIGSLVTCSGHAGSVHSAAWSPDGRRIASGSSDNTVKIWGAAAGNLLQTYRDHTGSVWGVVWSPDGTRVASASSDNTVKVWDTTTGVTQLTYTGHSSRVIFVAWSPDGRRIVSGSDDTTAQVWDAATGNLLITYQGHNKTVYGVAWSPDSRYVASGSVDTTVQVWDAASGATQLVYRGHSSFVFGVAWSPDGKRVASASDDRTVQVWRVWQ